MDEKGEEESWGTPPTPRQGDPCTPIYISDAENAESIIMVLCVLCVSAVNKCSLLTTDHSVHVSRFHA
jgi:hypothetical protein